MGKVKEEVIDDAATSFVIRHSCTPEPQARESVTAPNNEELSMQLKQLNDQFDQLTANSLAARETVKAAEEKLRATEKEHRAAEAKMKAAERKVKAAEEKVDTTRTALVDIGQKIKVLQDRLAGNDSLAPRTSAAETVQGPEACGSRICGEHSRLVRAKDKQRNSSASHEESSADEETIPMYNLKRPKKARIEDNRASDLGTTTNPLNYGNEIGNRAHSRSVVPHQDHSQPVIIPAEPVRSNCTLPFSHRSCDISSQPPSSIDPQPFLSFVMVLQEAQRNKKEEPLRKSNIIASTLRNDPNLLSRLSVTKGTKFITIAQQYLNIIVGGQLKSYLLRFGDVNRHWLLHPRNNVPSFDEQKKQLSRWELTNLPSSAPEVFYPLIEILSFVRPSTKNMSFRELRERLCPYGQLLGLLGSSEEITVQTFLDRASKWCNIQVMLRSASGGHVRLTDIQRPFRQEEDNDRYFNGGQYIPPHLRSSTGQASLQASLQARHGTATNAIPLGTKRRAEEDNGNQAGDSKGKRSRG